MNAQTHGIELPGDNVREFIESRLGRDIAGERGDRAGFADFDANDRAAIRAIGAGEGGSPVYAILYVRYRLRETTGLSAAIGFCNSLLNGCDR